MDHSRMLLIRELCLEAKSCCFHCPLSLYFPVSPCLNPVKSVSNRVNMLGWLNTVFVTGLRQYPFLTRENFSG